MIYTVHQNAFGFPALLELVKKYNIKKWVYFGEETLWRLKAEHQFSDKITKISTAEELECASRQLRTSFIESIGSLSPINDSFEWWASEISSKDPYNPLYLRICLERLGRNLIDSDATEELLIIFSSPALIEGLIEYASKNGKKVFEIKNNNTSREVFHRFETSLIQIIKMFPPIPALKSISHRYSDYLEENLLFRKRILKRKNIKPIQNFTGEKTILFFTYIDKRNFRPDDTYQDPHFGPLPDLLKKKGYNVAYVAKILNTISFEETVEKLHNINEIFLFPESFMESTDLFRCDLKSKQYNLIIDNSFTIHNIPAKGIIEENFAESRSTLANNLLYGILIEGMKKHGIYPERIIYTYEGQSWENALVWSIRHTLPDTKIIAYDNVTFSKMFLSKFHTKNELKIRPLPDRIVTNGRLFYNVLIQAGYSQEMISCGCALRHSYIWNQQKICQAHPRMNGRWRILVATSIGYEESLELIQKTCFACAGADEFDIIIKCHPLIDIFALKNDLKDFLIHPNIVFSDDQVGSLLTGVDILLYTTTSVCYEALNFGVFPICIHMENFVTLDRLDIAPDIRWVASTPEQIRQTIYSIIRLPDEKQREWSQKAIRVVNDALSPVDEHCIDPFII
nr:hypothetical protein [uncultured Methanoregula sp.]